MGADDTGCSFRLRDLVEQFGGSFTGDPNSEVGSFAPLEHARSDQLAFFTNPKYRNQLAHSKAAAILIKAADAAEFAPSDSPVNDRLWIVRDPYLMFGRVSQMFVESGAPLRPVGIHPSAVVDASARIDPSSSVGALAVVGERVLVSTGASVGAGCVLGDDVSIGAETTLYPRVTIYAKCSIGRRGIVHSGAVIGADGFGFAKEGQSWIKIPQIGKVIIGDDVEIGANTTIDRGALEDTVIGDGVKLDNQIQIAHNVHIGDHTAIAGCAGVAGSAVIGKRCTIAGSAGIAGHLILADDVHISASTTVTHSISRPGQYTGTYPISDHESWAKNAAVLRNLDKLRQRVRRIEQLLKEKEPT